MTAENYSASLRRVLVHEGGFVNHPKDPGGATMKGVTQAVYNAFRKRRGLTSQSVRGVSDGELEAIYRTQYADKIAFDKLPTGIDYVVFDGAVNSGPTQSTKWLQRALGVPVDGIIGNVTLAKAAVADHSHLIDAICDQRLKFLKGLTTWATFGRGWASRVEDVRRTAKAMATGTVIAPSLYLSDSYGEKALASDVAKPAAPIGGPTVGAGAGVLAGTLQSAKETLEPLLGTSTFVSNIYAGLTVALTAIAIAGVVYGVYAKIKHESAKEAIGAVL